MQSRDTWNLKWEKWDAGHAFDQCGLQQRFSVSEACPFSRNRFWMVEELAWCGPLKLQWQLPGFAQGFLNGAVKLFRSSSSSWFSGSESGSPVFTFRQCYLMGIPGGSAVKNLPATQEMQVWFLGWEDPLEKGMATHSSTLAWEIPWTEEPGGVQSMVTKSDPSHNLVTKPPALCHCRLIAVWLCVSCLPSLSPIFLL